MKLKEHTLPFHARVATTPAVSMEVYRVVLYPTLKNHYTILVSSWEFEIRTAFDDFTFSDCPTVNVSCKYLPFGRFCDWWWYWRTIYNISAGFYTKGQIIVVYCLRMLFRYDRTGD